jgi:hypothetical protein
MPDWREGYLASLQEAERNNPVNKDLVEACKLATSPSHSYYPYTIYTLDIAAIK